LRQIPDVVGVWIVLSISIVWTLGVWLMHGDEKMPRALWEAIIANGIFGALVFLHGLCATGGEVIRLTAFVSTHLTATGDFPVTRRGSMQKALGASAFLGLAFAMPMQDAAAQDPVGGAILGGAAGAIIGGAVGGGRGAAAGAIIGGATGAAIAAQGQPRPGGYRYYQNACYQQRPDGAWVAVAPERCAPPSIAPVAVRPVPDELSLRLVEFREGCEHHDRNACVRLGILIGENRERRAAWRREQPEAFFYDR
jgi:hypothetical protein